MRRLAVVTIVAVACTPVVVDQPADPTTTTMTTSSQSGAAATNTTPTTRTAEAPAITAGTASDLSCWTAQPAAGTGELVMRDVTEEVGITTPLLGMHGHAAIWTDIQGDGWPDVYVGTFADRPPEEYRHRGASAPSPDALLTNIGGTFESVPTMPFDLTRSSGGVSADLDGDGDLDLVVARNIRKDSDLTPTQLFDNVGGSLVPSVLGGIPDQFGGRSIAALDYDNDGLLDLFVTEDRYRGGSSVLLHNDGDLAFSIDRDAGIPKDVFGLGVATGDFNEDRHSDIFVSGSNRLFLSTGEGRFEEASNDVFEWAVFGTEDDVAGSSVGDANNDGHLDLLVGHHYNSTLESGAEVGVRLYLGDGKGEFVDVTESSGLPRLQTKAPHVEFQDFDNDGWLDILTSASAGAVPAIFMSTGEIDGVPRFESPPGLGGVQYWVTAPTADYDRDGRVDLLAVEWEPSLPTLLFRNETLSGNWLEVSIDHRLGHGLGWTIQAESDDGTVRSATVTASQGYGGGVIPSVHFGLGKVDSATVRIIPPDGDIQELLAVAANQHIRWPRGCR